MCNWAGIFAVKSSQSLDDKLGKYTGVFSPRMGNMQHKTKVRVKLSTTLFEPLYKELEDLGCRHLLKKVAHSDWASPVVVGPRSNNSICICSDYKVTGDWYVPQEHL